MPGTEHGHLHDLCWPYQSILYSQSWGSLENYGKVWLSDKFIAMVRQFHDGMLARVQNDGEFSGLFPVTNGVKQGCVLAPTLFSMMFSAMLTAAFEDGDNGIPIRYRFDEKLFKLRRMKAKSKVQTEVLDKFFFADDVANNRREDAKRCRSRIWLLWQLWTHNQHQKDRGGLPGKPCKEPTITVKGQRLQVVDKFTYLGST